MNVDVCIAGGGLAGLTLARQLRLTMPQLKIVVLEKRSHPAPEAAHKVGESSVEIGAHYFGKVLGLEPHLHARGAQCIANAPRRLRVLGCIAEKDGAAGRGTLNAQL